MQAGDSGYLCSFCGKRQEQVHRLIAGPGGVYICDECVTLCGEIIAEETTVSAAPGTPGANAGVQGHAVLAGGDMAAALATIERLAGENGELRERLRALDTARE